MNYYKLVASQGKSKDYSELKNEMTKFYRAVYEDEMTDFYRGIYQDAMSDMYDTYYAGVLQSSSGKVAYKTLSDECTEFYRDYSDVLSAFYNKEYDVDKTLGNK